MSFASRTPKNRRVLDRTRMAGAGAGTGSGGDSSSDDDMGPEMLGPRRHTNSMGFGRRKDQVQVPVDIPELLDGVKVDVYVRVRPLFESERSDRIVLRTNPAEGGIKIKALGAFSTSDKYYYDGVFSPEANQEEVYSAIRPIVNNVLKGQNCCAFAYGQTGTGKTYTVMGDFKDPGRRGIIPRAIQDIFSQLKTRGGDFKVAISYLEVYNEQLLDLLIPADAAIPLRLVEDPVRGVVCQNLTEVEVGSSAEVVALVSEGNKRCQVASTSVNQRSNRAHRIFIASVRFQKNPKLDGVMVEADSIIDEAATSHAASSSLSSSLSSSSPSHKGRNKLTELGCLTIVDLAGSECVGRSGATDGRLIEAGNINKSLLTLGRVINSLANNELRIPYRDSKLTRILAEALGGRCKTAIIATVAPGSANATESASTLKYAERARAALNATQLSKSQVLEAKLGRLTQLYRELQADMQRELESFEQERKLVQRTHETELRALKAEHAAELARHMDDRRRLIADADATVRAVHKSEVSFLRTARKGSGKLEAALARSLATMNEDVAALKTSLAEGVEVSSRQTQEHSNSIAELVTSMSDRLGSLTKLVQTKIAQNEDALQRQREVMQLYAKSEADAMRKTSEEMIQRMAKIMSRQAKMHSQRVHDAVSTVLDGTSSLLEENVAIAKITEETTSSIAGSVVEWSKSASERLTSSTDEEERLVSSRSMLLSNLQDTAEAMKERSTTQVRDMYSNCVHHNSVVEEEVRKAQRRKTDADTRTKALMENHNHHHPHHHFAVTVSSTASAITGDSKRSSGGGGDHRDRDTSSPQLTEVSAESVASASGGTAGTGAGSSGTSREGRRVHNGIGPGTRRAGAVRGSATTTTTAAGGVPGSGQGSTTAGGESTEQQVTGDASKGAEGSLEVLSSLARALSKPAFVVAPADVPIEAPVPEPATPLTTPLPSPSPDTDLEYPSASPLSLSSYEEDENPGRM